MSKRRVLFVTASMQGGGTERVIAVLAEYFVRQDIDVTILMTAGDEVAYNLNANVKVISLGGKTGGNIWKRLSRIWNMRCIFKRYSRNTIFSLGTETNLFSIIANIGLKGKLILSERNDPNQCTYSRMRDFLYEFGDFFVFQTEDAKRCFSSRIQKRSCVIGNPIRKDLQAPYEGERKKIIAAVGRLEKQKNYPLLLKSFAKFHKKYEEYHLHIYGQGELRNELIDMCKKLAIDNWVEFKGFHKDAINKIKDVMMYILSSDYEGISNSLLEAMAIGIPVISTDCPIGGSGMCIQDKVNGILVPVESEDDLVRAMEFMVENEEERLQMSKEAVKVREVFSEENICQRWLGLVEKQGEN